MSFSGEREHKPKNVSGVDYKDQQKERKEDDHRHLSGCKKNVSAGFLPSVKRSKIAGTEGGTIATLTQNFTPFTEQKQEKVSSRKGERPGTDPILSDGIGTDEMVLTNEIIRFIYGSVPARKVT